MLRILLILSVLFASKVGLAKQEKKELLDSYLVMKNALVQSDATKTKEEASVALKKWSTATDVSKKENILKLLKKIAALSDLEKQRKLFSELSVLLWEIIKNDKSITQKLYYDYCPMKKMYWISEFETIKNPYYGSKMLNCGSVKETIN